jgi:hypothetical protein
MVVMAAAIGASTATGVVVGDGRGRPERDCHVGLAGYSPADLSPLGPKGNRTGIVCTDCDPACDLDAIDAPNGACTFRIAACVNQPGVAGCDPGPFTRVRARAKVRKRAALDLASGLPADGSSVCGAFQDFVVPMAKRGTKPGKGRVTLATRKPNDKDTFTFVCVPRPKGEPCPTTTSTTTTTTTVSPSTTLMHHHPYCPPGPCPPDPNVWRDPYCPPEPPCPPCVPPGPGDVRAVQFSTRPGTDSCGDRPWTPPKPPFGGEIRDCGDGKILDVGLGCLLFGAGQSVIPGGAMPDAAPNVYDVQMVCPRGRLLLQGGAGTNDRDCTLGVDEGIRYCANGMPGTDGSGACHADADCLPLCQDPAGGTCEAGETCTCANGGPTCTSDRNCWTGATLLLCVPRPKCFFGPPLPIGDGELSLCVQTTYRADPSGVADTIRGELSLSLPLSLRIHLTGTHFGQEQPCPACVDGTCDGGPNEGMACTGVGEAGSTHDCPPFAWQYLGQIDPTPGVLTTEGSMLPTDGSVAADGVLCPGQVVPGAFSDRDVCRIIAYGDVALGGFSGTPASITLGSAFCVPKTGNILLDGATSLPGPGLISLPGDVTLLPKGPDIDGSFPSVTALPPRQSGRPHRRRLPERP